LIINNNYFSVLFAHVVKGLYICRVEINKLKQMTTKTCTKCNSLKEASIDNFHLRWNSSKTKKVFRAKCKVCFNNENTENRILKRCKEEGIERSEWDSFKRSELMNRDIFKLKDERLKNIPRPTRARILRKIREDNYVFTSYEQYKKDCSINRSLAQRKYDYDGVDLLNSDIITKKMPDYYIASRLKMNLKDIPKEIIETKRLLIKIKRELTTLKQNDYAN